MLQFLKSADCPRNDKGIIKVAGGNFKTLFLVGSKKKKKKTFKMDLFKRCHISYLQAFRLKRSKRTLFSPKLRRISLKPSILLNGNITLGKQ